MVNFSHLFYHFAIFLIISDKNARLIIMNAKTRYSLIVAGIVALFLISSLSAVPIGPATAKNPSTTPLHTNISLNSVDLNAYTDTVSTNTPLITGNSIQLTELPSGLAFLSNTSSSNIYTTANVGTMTILSSQSLFPNFSANAYNLEFLNSSFNAISYASNDPSHNFVGTAPSVSPTTLTAYGYSNGTGITGTWTSQMGNKLYSTDTYSSPGAVDYIPLSNTNFWLLINLYATGGSSSDSASITVAMKTNTNDFTYTFNVYNTTGTTGYTLTTSSVTFNAYSAFGKHITMAIPVAQSWTDSGTSDTIKGIDYTQIAIHSADANTANKVSLESHNIAITSQLPALTNNANLGGYYKYKDATNSLPVNPWEGEDILQTDISGPTSTTYNNNMPILNNVLATSNFATLMSFQEIHFQGTMSLLPTTQSDVSSGSNKAGGYITNEITTFDIRSINPATNSFYKSAELATIFSVTSWYFNVTLSPVVLEPISSYYGDAYIQNSYTQNNNPTPSAYNVLWQGYAITSTPIDVRYGITAFSLTTGEIDTFTIGYISQTSYNSQTKIGGSGSGSGSGSGNNNSTPTSSMDTYIIIAGFAVIVGLFIVWHKKKR